jgi:hypothetical protein
MKKLTLAVVATLALTGFAFAQSGSSNTGQKSGDASSGSSMQKSNTTGSASTQDNALKNGDGSTGNVAGDLSKDGNASSSQGSRK